jgi:hypothetical protein
MSARISTRSWATRAAAVAAAAGTVAVGAVALAGSASATASTLVTVTGVNVHHVAALTANQVITLTGTGFDEANIASVAIHGCTNNPSYIVQSATSLLLKTDNSCAASTITSNVSQPEAITITDTATTPGTASFTGTAATGLSFVAAPTIVSNDGTTTPATRPMMTENTSAAAFADQVHSAPINGGTVVRIKAGAGYTFMNSSAWPLSASIDGVALTGIKLGTAGAYFTGTLPAHAADAAPTLKVTSNGVSSTFKYHASSSSTAYPGTIDFTLGNGGANVQIAVTPSFGPVNGGNVITVTGVGFQGSSGATPTTVTVGGVSCPVTGTVTATKLTCTVPALTAGTAPGPVTVVTTTGSVTSVVSGGSTYTYSGV